MSRPRVRESAIGWIWQDGQTCIVRLRFPVLLDGAHLAACLCGRHFRMRLESACPHCGRQWRHEIVPSTKDGYEPKGWQGWMHHANWLRSQRVWLMRHAQYLKRCKRDLSDTVFWARLANHLRLRCLKQAAAMKETPDRG